MGSGKSTLGRRLARRLGRTFIDLDQQVVAEANMSIPDYFEKHGEGMFRELERDVLRGLDLSHPAVVATGGGTPCFHANMDWMNEHGVTMYLRMESKALWRRLNQSDVASRPVLQGLKGSELLEFVEAKLAVRHPFYQQAQCVVDPIRDTVSDMIHKCGINNA